MSFTFLLWFSVTAFLFCFWAWTIFAVYKQKKAWRFFAEKKKLRYEPQGFFVSPSLSGVIDDYKVSIFASEHSELDQRYDRRLTAIEVMLKTKFPGVGIAAASGGMAPIIETLDLPQEYKPKHEGWDDTYVLKTDEPMVTELYCTQDRIDKLTALMKVEKCWVVALFANGQALLRVDTPLPLDHPKKLDDLLKQMIEAAKVLELAKGEDKDLLRKAQNKQKVLGPIIDVDEDIFSDDVGLELDDE